VSVELHPAIGYDIDKTLRYAQHYYAIQSGAIHREDLMKRRKALRYRAL